MYGINKILYMAMRLGGIQGVDGLGTKGKREFLGVWGRFLRRCK